MNDLSYIYSALKADSGHFKQGEYNYPWPARFLIIHVSFWFSLLVRHYLPIQNIQTLSPPMFQGAGYKRGTRGGKIFQVRWRKPRLWQRMYSEGSILAGPTVRFFCSRPSDRWHAENLWEVGEIFPLRPTRSRNRYTCSLSQSCFWNPPIWQSTTERKNQSIFSNLT